ncbi:Spy/CpxP family protein refolding chaperone [Phenylobacterium sp.]|uniref:Spy/CpxP family protein refolding chaperone n=1 Tax=Phenylobacterium sp. TaxID=1871053 RepID=UPI002C581089|nr:Spy/CpxP family protein refolding chaperone [Phenylobacterium sp.]HLZ76280.1 Spy/CpxP family protein refolding chaperone [Phenylobacterium sp.]
MTSTIRHAALAALAAATLAGSTAWAQQDDHRGPPNGAGADRAQMRARFEAMHEAREKQHAQDLRTILRLRPDQEGALTAFLQSHKRPDGPPAGGRRGPPGGPGAGPRPPMAAPPMTTPQRLDEMARRESEHAAMQQKHAEALRTFYAALSPEQRQVFDALQRMHGGHEHGGWGGHRGFGGPMGGRFGGPGGPPRGD